MKACPSCGEQNPDRFRVCPICGTPLPDTKSPGREERKVVTVLFCDLVGFTSRSEAMDVEDVRGTLAPYHDLLRRELERHGGTVEKFIGDAVMALFGAPIAHEDDPERAVRAGLAILDAVARLCDDDAALDLHVRVGVNTGEALIALGANPAAGEGMASGDVVNTAARLQSAAPVDGMLVGEETYRATSRAIHYDPAEPIQAKGKTEPVAVWVAREPRSIVAASEADTASTLVGRDQELQLLVAALERARRERSVQLVTLVGVPGIGKSRMVAELGGYVESEPGLTTWRQGRSLAYGEGVAFWALGEVVKAQAGILESDADTTAGEKLRDAVVAVLDDARDADWVEQHLRPLVGLEAAASVGESARVEAFAAWRRFVEAVAESGPAVVVFEDLHWADDALLDFVDLLAERAVGVPLLLVCTARPELLERRGGWGGGKTNALTVSLSPLADEDTARLVGGLLEQALLPADTQATLLERAEGNPLYAQEYVRMLIDRDLLVRTAGGWTLTGEAHELPASVAGIIAARLDALSAEEKALVQDAAVIGRTGWIGAVVAIGDRSRFEADAVVHHLERRQLVRRARRSSVAGEEEFAFAHSLTQEVAYGQIPRARRAEKHVRAAGWIEQLAGGRDDKAELLSHHYQTALQLMTQLGQDTTELEPRARAAFAEAGRQAVAVNAHSAAGRHLDAALALTPADDPARAALMLDHATALWRAGEASENSLTGARDAQVSAEDWEAAGWAEYLLANWYDKLGGEGARVDEHAAQAADYARRAPPSARNGQIDALRALRLYVQGRYQEVITLAQKSIAYAEQTGLDEVRGLLLTWLGVARMETGDASGVADTEQAAKILAAHNHPRTASALGNLANQIRGLGDLPRAAAVYADAWKWAQRFAEPGAMSWVEVERAVDDYQAGRWQRAFLTALAHLNDAEWVAASVAHDVHGRIVLARDQPRQALRDAAHSIDGTDSADDSESLLLGLALRALAHDGASDTHQALVACTAFLAEWTRIGGMLARLENLAEIAPILATAGRHGEIEAAVAQVKAPSRWADAILAFSHRRYSEAADICGEIGSLPDQAAAHLLAAEDHMASGRASAATQHLDAALAFYRSVDATLYLRRADALRAQSA